MVKLELYIREITRFLRTVTIKNKYFADQMMDTWVNPKYRYSLSIEDQPYYRHLSGKYILSETNFEIAREKLGLPARARCSELKAILLDTKSHRESEVNAAYSEFNRCKDILDYPNLAISSLDFEIVNYMNTRYGLTKTVKINGIPVSTDKVYSKFDNVPFVYSFDTKEKVPFTFNLINSPEQRKTRATYKIPSSYYDKLIGEYDNEKDIIKNILYPISMSLFEAYEADNYDVLGCDLTQLEENERTSLYNAMIEKLNVIKRRWDVGNFVYEELYALSMQAKIWSVLMAELFKQRVVNIRTSEVHSYHLWNYLASKGIKDYSDVLTHKQALFLYKNYPWIHRHKGSDHNLLLLTNKLLNDHNLTVHDKTVVQDTSTVKSEASSTPYVASREIQKEVLSSLRTINKNDESYFNKTRKAIDELISFKYTHTDATQIQTSDEESLEQTFVKERYSDLEYKDDALFYNSTLSDTKTTSVSPYTNLTTKLLEIKPNDRDDIFSKMYIRFVTESILYNVAMGCADAILKLEYGETTAYLSVKDLLVLFYYCESQKHGDFSRTVDGKTSIRDVAIPKYVYLTVPYKKNFSPLTDDYKWRNIERYNPYVLSIVPDEMTLKSSTLPEEANGVYQLVDSSPDVRDWKWISDNRSTIEYKADESSSGRWVFSIITGSGETSGSFITHSDVKIPYWNWLCWHPDMVFTDSNGNDVVEDADIQVTKFHYAIDDMMPNYETYAYIDNEIPDGSLVHLIDRQASAYVKMYKEYTFSGLSRQHSAFTEILDSRTFRGVVDLNLSKYTTFREHIDANPDMANILAGFDSLSDSLRAEEYSYLADTIVKLLYPIQSEHLTSSSMQMNNSLNRIKDLVAELSSYNVAWMIDTNSFGNVTIDCLGNNTMDIVDIEYGMEDVSKVDESKSEIEYHQGFVDEFCYDDVCDKAYVLNDDNRLEIVTTDVHHVCQDHQYVISSVIDSSMNTIIADIEFGTNDASIRHSIHNVLSLPDSDFPRDAYIPTAYEIKSMMEDFVEHMNLPQFEYSATVHGGNTISVPSKEQVVVNLCNMYNAKFNESTFASMLEYDSSYRYIPPSYGTSSSTSQQPLRK